MSLSASSKSALERAKSVAKYPRLYSAAGMRGTTRLGLVYGNCQAEPLRQLLTGTKKLGYDLVKIPPVHLISRSELRLVAKIASQAHLFIHQHVKATYRDLGQGTDELAGLLPASATRLSIPVAFHNGLHPFQVYIRDDSGMNVAMPVTGYHDLRFLSAAGRGMSAAEGAGWLDAYKTSESVLKRITQESIEQLVQRECSLDIRVSPHIDTSDVDGFLSVNHPGNHLLAAQANEILLKLGVAAEVSPGARPMLGPDNSLIDDFVAAANGSSSGGVPARFNGRTYTRSELWKLAIAWYQERPDVVARGLEVHQKKIELLGLV